MTDFPQLLTPGVAARPLSAPVLAVVAGVLALAAVAVLGAVAWLRAELAPRGSEGRAMARAAAGLAGVVLGLRLALAAGQVSWCPYLDQWHAEVAGLLAPLAHGTLTAADLGAGNNEHRVLLTRVLALGCALVNGSWDNRVLVLGTYLLEAGMVGWVALLSWLSLGWIRGLYVAAAALLPMALVCDWEVLVSSNQTQFVTMAAGTVLALSLAAGPAPRFPAAAAALALAVLMLGSMASGLLTAAVLLAGVAGTALVTRRLSLTALVLGVAGAGLVGLGAMMRVVFSGLDSLHAGDAGQWARAFAAYAAWPLPPGIFGLALLWLPWAALLWRTLRERDPRGLSPFALGLGLWVLLQAGVLAWSRSGLSALVSSRYTEFIGLGVLANALALALLFQPRRPGARAPGAGWVAMVLWLAVIGGAEARDSARTYRPYLADFHAQALGQERRLATFARTGDAGPIESARFPDIPYGAPEILAALRDPAVDALLPVPLRPFPGPVGPLAAAADLAFRFGPWIAVLGAALAVTAFLGWLFGGDPVTPPRRRAAPAVPAAPGTSPEFSLHPRP